MRYWEFFPAPEGWGRVPVWGFADVAASRADGVREGVALTSARNRAFCERTGYYDRVVSYDGIPQLSAATPTVLVDMTANMNVLRAVHQHFGEALRYSCLFAFLESAQARLQFDYR